MLTKDRIGALLLLAFCSAYWALATEIRMLPFQANQAFNAQTMPLALGAMGVGLSLAIFISPGSGERPTLSGFRWGLAGAMLALMVFYGLTIRPLGFLTSTTLFLIGGYMVLGERNPITLILASVPIVVAFWALMTQGLDIYIAPWPAGVDALLSGGGDA